MNRLTWIFFGGLLMTTANSASFDCGKAMSKVEKHICSNATLSELDETMSAAYKIALKGGAHPVFDRQEQRKWLLQRNRCPDVVCLTDTYTRRIAQLSSTGNTQSTQPSSKIQSNDAEACRKVAEHLNRNTIMELRVRPVENTPSLEEIKNIFDEQFYIGSHQYWSVDLNNDGILDHLLISTDGTAHFTSVFARSGKNGAVRVEMGTDVEKIGGPGATFDPLSTADVLSVIGRHYIFDGYWLWNLTKDGEFQAACQFEEVGRPIVNFVMGRETPLCSAILSGEHEIQHVSYDLEYKLSAPLPDEERFNPPSRESDIFGARLDINNDGEVENVVRLEYWFPGGRGCSAMNLAVTDNNATHIPDTKLNQLLLDELASHPCGPSLDALVHDGVTYVDAIQHDISYMDALDKGGHTLYRIKQDKAEKVCESRTRINVRAVGVSSGH